ncbi:putative CCHC-type domain-containing protein [Seiridium cardinale]|uniref:CCHC-type domain-containing protein n=1 Tax=Seiridium cardinale TaxID=138064 RepID=A0ABR2X663_9PEZI
MARSTSGEIAESQTNQAKQQVRFETDAFEKQLPRTNYDTQGDLRRRSRSSMTNVLPSHEAATATLGDQEEYDMEDPNSTYTTYKEMMEGRLDTLTYAETLEDILDTDVALRLEHMAEHFGKKGPAMPFVPLTEEGKTQWPNFDGLVGIDQFVKMAEKNTDALFAEMKLRSLLAIVHRTQLKDLHTITQELSATIRQMHDWADFLGRKWDEEKTKSAAAEAVWEDQVKDLEEQIAGLKDTVVKMAQQPTRFTRDGTPSSFVSSGGTHHGRTAKAAEPGTFTNKKEDVDFNHWFMLLKGKLKDNADHYSTESSKIHYILGKMGKPASDDLLPFVHSEHGAEPLYTTSEQVLNHLETYYRNPNARDEAHEKYKALTMDNNAIFRNFRLEFVKLAGLSGIARSEYKRDINDKIPARLNERVVEKLDNDAISFEEFCSTLIQYDNQQHKNFVKKSANKTLQANREKTNTTNGNGNKYGTKTGTQGSATTPSTPTSTTASTAANFGATLLGTTSNGNKLWKAPRDMEDRKKLIREGRCFTCHEPGHRSTACPHKEDAAKMEENRINEIVSKTTTSNHAKLMAAAAMDKGQEN